ncbi:esterase/lipase family protein [Gordonia sp. DT218]|uniref:esterase/lipase family protein n=1 Tax=Gordonia sp. DT218 TaxID=3416659 RepID=UPI003CEB53A3
MAPFVDRRQAELSALAGLAGTELRRATTGVAKVHASIADGVFGGLRIAFGRRADPVRMVHNAFALAAYSTAGGSADLVGKLAGIVAEVPTAGRAPSETSGGAVALGILNGLIGDELSEEASPLAAGMTIRVDGREIPPTAEALRAAFPTAGGHLTVFLHGLMESEYAWEIGGGPTYGRRLSDDIGSTEIRIRYNSGRHVSDNGRLLADVLWALVLLWPVPVTDLSLIGHSMGGLIIRSACERATREDLYWAALLRHTVYLGTPHLGAPMARGVHAATAALGGLPVTNPFGNLLRRRSAGVRDLFHGTLTEEGWRDVERDVLRQPLPGDAPLLPNVRHLFATASVTRSADHPLGRLFGDGLVLAGSGRGQSRYRTIGLRSSDGFHIGSAHHFTLLNHDGIYAWLRSELRPRRALESRSDAFRINVR